MLAQENYKKVPPEKSLLNLEELITHNARDPAKVLKELPQLEELHGEDEGMKFN